ncbi:MAG TPA: hypothetical protein VES42_20010 [Pilimelia sp.]|nr:hypothetical protein [Pilimelia sp.]
MLSSRTRAGPSPPASAGRRWPLWAAAALALAIVVLHVVDGQPENLDPLLASDLTAAPRQLFRVLWHVSTALLATFPVALAWAAGADRAVAAPVLVYVWVLAAAFAAIFLAVGVAAFGPAGLLTLPQWLLFLPLLVLLPIAR